MLCPNCSSELPDSATQCPNCLAHVIPVAAATLINGQPVAGAQNQASAYASYAPGPSNDPYAQAQQYANYGNPQPGAGAQAGPQSYQYQAPQYGQPQPAGFTPTRKNHIVAGVLAIFLGSLGIHKFYLGYTKPGIIMLLVTLLGSLVTFGLAALVMDIIGIIEGIMYLVKSDEEFYYTYELTTKEWF